MYVAIPASVGPVPIAVTTQSNSTYLRNRARDLIAEVKRQLGKRLMRWGTLRSIRTAEDEMVGARHPRPIRSRRPRSC